MAGALNRKSTDGFEFLGQNVRKYGGKLLIKPSAKNVKALLDNVRETIRVSCSTKQETLIRSLNPMIMGRRTIIDTSSQRRRT
jgi:RNA-directed DNA polymerase